MTTLDQVLMGELDRFADPLRAIATGPEGLQEILGRMGWDFTCVAESEVDAVVDAAVAMAEAAGELLDGAGEPTGLLEVLEALAAIGEVMAGVDDLATALGAIDLDPAPTAQDVAAELLGFLVARYLRIHHPPIYGLLRLLRLLDGPSEALPPARVVQRGTDCTVRWARPFGRVHLERLPALLEDPAALMGGHYLPGGLGALQDASDVEGLVERLWGPLRELVFHLGGDPSSGAPTTVDLRGDAQVMAYARSLLRLGFDAGASGSFGVRITPVGAHMGGPYLVVSPFGEADRGWDLGGWTLYASADLDVEPILFGPGYAVPPGDAEVSGELHLVKNPSASGEAFLVGSPGSTRLELGEFSVALTAEVSPDTYDWGPSLLARQGKVVVDPADADAFLALLLGGGVEADFDLHLRWSRLGGVHFHGSAGLTRRFGIGRSIGPIRIEAGELSLLPGGDEVELAARLDLGCVLGPFDLEVEGPGVRVDLTFPEAGGNLGPLDLSLGLAPPTRVGFCLDAPSVKGGGLVDHDPETGRYVGALSLDMLSIGIDALVVVDTRLPASLGGWALFASLSATFPGIPLGFGFTLEGVGGLLALNRTLDTEALALGLRSGAVDDLLFPEDPVHGATELVGQIDEYFPLRAENTVIGPIIEVGWGTPTLLSAQLGVVLSLPDGIVAVMGSLEAFLPTPDAPLLTLHMDALGVVDVGSGTCSLTASLYDSRLLETIDLSGDMAMYLATQGQPYFLLSVGGFHPGFEPPSVVPASMHDLRRMQAAITLAPFVSVVVQSYFALTSNSVQFGASVTLEASVDVWPATYTARGWFAFDVLLEFSPFRIEAGMSAGVGIYSGNKELMGVQLAFLLEGPEPWQAVGTASFKFFGVKVEFAFEVGAGAGSEPKPLAYPRREAAQALRSPSAWSESGPVEGLSAGLIYTGSSEEDDDVVWIRPDHQVSVRQTVAPLERELEIVGQAVPGPGEELLSVTAMGFGDEEVEIVHAHDWFAPAQFEALGPAARLSRASFEEMPAGVTFGDPSTAVTSWPEELGREVPLVYEEGELEVPYEDGTLENAVGLGAAARGVRGFEPHVDPLFTIHPTSYTVVRTADGIEANRALQDAGVATGGVDQYSARSAFGARVASDPSEGARLAVVPASASPSVDPLPIDSPPRPPIAGGSRE